MSKYILRLDDASEYMCCANWKRIESLLDKYEIKPIVGIIPHNEDPELLKYERDDAFWKRVANWHSKGWEIALHGYNHVFVSEAGGLNPVNTRSEFAGVSIDIQKEKISCGIQILNEHNIYPRVFFAPAHTFDNNTLLALKERSDIRIISDTIANKTYSFNDFTFVPQQSGKCRKLPFHTITFCYHPNSMTEKDFISLELFLMKHNTKFICFPTETTKNKLGLLDKILKKMYFARRKNM